MDGFAVVTWGISC